jgi:hypothetical protein
MARLLWFCSAPSRVTNPSTLKLGTTATVDNIAILLSRSCLHQLPTLFYHTHAPPSCLLCLAAPFGPTHSFILSLHRQRLSTMKVLQLAGLFVGAVSAVNTLVVRNGE